MKKLILTFSFLVLFFRHFAGIGIHYPNAAKVHRKKRQFYGK